jgi:hypothetical protein
VKIAAPQLPAEIRSNTGTAKPFIPDIAMCCQPKIRAWVPSRFERSIKACACVLLCFSGWMAQAAFTNSASLTPTVSGTNLVLKYSVATTEGWVTLLSAGDLGPLTTAPQFVDAVPVPPSRQGQFLVPLLPSATARFYCLLLEPLPSYRANYPDLSVIMPSGQTSIVGTGTNRQFRYTHLSYNGGSGPLVIRPVYNPASGHYQGYQEIYYYQSNSWTLVRTNPVAGAFIFHPEHGHFHFPFAQFGLYHRNPDGSVGALVGLSEKNGFCIADSYLYNPDLPNAGAFGFAGGGCSDPTTLRGLSIGAVDEYNYLDPGQSISIPGLPDGNYWLRAIADPDNYLRESNETNNETYMEVTITGDTVTEGQIITPALTPSPTITLTAPTAGLLTGTVQLVASTAAPGANGVQFLVDGLPFGSVVAGPPYSLSWNTTTVANGTHWLAAQTTDANSRTGTSDVTLVTVNNFATNAPLVQVTGPEAGATLSAVVTVSADVASASSIASVQFYVDGAPIGAALTAPPFMMSWNTLTVTNGGHVVTATATDLGGLTGYSQPVSVTVDNSRPPNVIGVGATVFADDQDTLTTPPFSTKTASDFLVAFVAYDGPSFGPQTATVSGAGLLWQLAVRGNSQLGTSEIWIAKATNQMSSVTVTSSPEIVGFHGSLTVIAFTNASGPGVVGQASAPTGPPDVYVPGVQTGSWVFAVGNDWDGAVARTPVSGQTLVHQWIDTQVGDTFWVQSMAAPAVGLGLVNIHDTAPTNHQWNYSALEIIATRH